MSIFKKSQSNVEKSETEVAAPPILGTIVFDHVSGAPNLAAFLDALLAHDDEVDPMAPARAVS